MTSGPAPSIPESDVAARRAHDARMRSLADVVLPLGHELNNLFTSIVGCLEILGEEHGREPAGSGAGILIADALSASRDGLELMDRLRACVGRGSLAPGRVEVDAITAALSGLLARTLPADVSFEVRAGAGLPALRADPARLESALLDLAVNAREAMPRGGRIGLEVAAVELTDAGAARLGGIRAGRFVQFTVSDTGTGIDAAIAARIYDPFFTTRSPAGGRGLGLSMAYGFARQSGGCLAVDRSGPAGTKVRVLLPAWDVPGAG